MDYLKVHQALREVRNLKRSILDKQRFKGYSGRARAIGGCMALAAVPGILAWPGRPIPLDYIFMAWGAVFVASASLNCGALLVWFARDGQGELRQLTPFLETMPVWICGGAVTVALWRNGQYDLLYGIWMSLFGLAQGIARTALPKSIIWIGAFYLVCGFICLLWSEGMFQRPWIMGSVFFIGEFAAGFVLHFDRSGGGAAHFFGLSQHTHNGLQQQDKP